MKDIYNHAPCGYHSLDKDGTIRRINDTELAWLGYTRDELVGRVNWLDLVTPASRQIFRDNFPQFLKQGFVHDLEFEIIRKDGTTFTGLVNATAIYDHNGDYFISRSTVVDITARKKTEDMLRFHSEILKNVSEGIILIRSSNGEIVYANPRFERMFGYARDELLGKHVSVINAPSNLSPEAIAKEISDELNKNWRWSGEVHNIRKDRKTFWCHASVSTYTHPEYGRVWVAVHEDITQHRQLEDDLRESEKCRHLLEYQEIVQTSLDGFWIVDTSKGRILEVNDKYCNMVGYSKEEILSMTIQDLEAIETPEEIEARLNRILEVGYDRFETRHRHKQGHMVDFEVSVTHSKANGGRNLAFFREITERNRMLEALTKSEANYRILFRNSRDAMLTAMAVPPLQFTSANHSAMLMFGAKNEDELIGFRPWELSPERQPDGLKSSVKARQMIEIAVQNGSHFFEWVHKRLNGKTFPAEILLTRLAQDGANYIQATIRDISERKKTEREMLGHRNEMEQIQKMYVAAQTASAIAHEINQPLLAITSYSEAALMMMKSRKPDYDEICNAIEKSEQQALRAGRAIRDLIEFLNINDFAVEPFDFNKEIINVVGVAKSEHNLALVQANRTHTQKVLLNLIHNGIDATQAAGVPLPVITVTVCTTKDKKFAQMTIRDNGPGIKKEDVNRLFEPFFTTKAKGIGMGLAISRSLIEENGGQLWFDPQEGSGATFHLTLPLAI
jgi:PAS domain S-box-containing protein